MANSMSAACGSAKRRAVVLFEGVGDVLGKDEGGRLVRAEYCCDGRWHVRHGRDARY